MDSLGNCWIDEELKKIPLPTNMRSMNFSTKPIIRGQRGPLDNPDAKVIRPFVHWMDKHGSEDLDLSVTFVGDKISVQRRHSSPIAILLRKLGALDSNLPSEWESTHQRPVCHHESGIGSMHGDFDDGAVVLVVGTMPLKFVVVASVR
jgi:hypothetical protein